MNKLILTSCLLALVLAISVLAHADGVSTLWPGGHPRPGSGNHSWGMGGSPYTKAAAKYQQLFGRAQPARNPVGTAPVFPSK